MVDDIRRQNSADKNKNNDSSLFPGIRPESSSAKNGAPAASTNLKSAVTEAATVKNHEKTWKQQFFSRGLVVWPHTEKQKTIGLAIIALLLIFGSILVYGLNKYANRPFEISDSTITFKPKTTTPSRLTGVEIPLELNKRRVTSIMIENSPDARPQSGLYGAGVVFEAISEGGITRFNALYQEAQPSYIGPIRSVRPYYVDLTAPFDPAFVHAGGSGEGLAKLARNKIKDLDHGANAGAFQRISSRVAPHNLYSSMKALDQAARQRGYKTSKFTGWLRKKPSPPAKAAKVTKIDLTISSPLYNVSYNYDKKSNSYARRMAGRPHVDEKAKKQIKPKVVIALVMKYSKNGIYSVYKTTGKGDMFVFQDGKVIKGKWKKKNTKSQFKFLDKKGQPIRLNAGQTWVTLVGNSGEVNFSN